ncbi:collagen alpha-1(XIV) chain-like [Etheostoma cragini]|uniref:collagen alpha-1(XIV) chain-like n=1 Tax=Etheostoma cragini TaxID=417921 RepID=UPI00155E56F6|nr:collagen alpha-1(XIV) chain-like [Etheostoma cragini]
MRFSVRLSVCVLGFVLVSLFPQPARGQVSTPRRFRAKVLSPTELHVSWKEPKGQFDSYKVVYTTRPGAEKKEFQVSKQEAKLLIQDFDPSKEYNFKIMAVGGGQQSKPLHAKHEAQSGVEMVQSQRRPDGRVAEENNEISEDEEMFSCTTQAISDIVILVDGSWSIGRINFRLVRTFLENLVKAFSVEFDKTRIGLAQYSGDPRIEWHLNAHTTKEAVMEAVKNLPYKGGNTLTGLALTFILENSFKPESGARPGVPKIGILITDGKSQDDVIPPARSLRDAGIELFAIGTPHLHFPLSAPRNLRLSEEWYNRFRISWDVPPSPTMGYRVVYQPLSAPGPALETFVGEDVNTMLIVNLLSGTEYSVKVIASYTTGSSEALSGRAKTLALPMVNDLELFDITHSTMRVRWKTAAGASGYMILYAPLTEGDPADEKEVPLTPARNLRFSDVDHSSARLRWDSSSRKAKGYRIMYVKTNGVQTNEMAARRTSYSVTGLSPFIRLHHCCSVIVFTLSDPPAPRFGVRNMRIDDETTYSMRVAWQPGDSRNVRHYRLSYISAKGDRAEEQRTVPTNQNSLILQPLLSDTEYKVSITPVYPDGDGPTAARMGRTPTPGSSLRNPRAAARLRAVNGGHVVAGGLRVRNNGHYCLPTGGRRLLPIPTPAPTKPPTTTPLPTIPPAKEVCKAAKADLVFLVDGSWSIGDDNFLKIIRFLYSTSGALDRIGPAGTQVAIAQFSDDARTEFKLNSYADKERLLDAINKISYKGGNTKTGRAIQHVKENIFTAEGGMRRGVPNVLVVLTDGRSQDDVNKVSKEMQMEGYIVFAIGFADADYGELVSIASKPSDRHVFFVDDLDAFAKIEEKLVTFVCEAATATCPSVPMSGSTTPGFRMMELFGLVENRYGSVSGVSMVPGTFNTFPCFHLHSNALMAQPTRYIHPEGLPSDYTITLLFRLLPDTPEEPFALWEVLNKDNEPLVGVILDNGGKTLTFFNNDYKGEFQTVTFEGPEIKKLFYGSFHKLHLAISKTSAKVVIDCKTVAEKTINAAGNITVDGTEVLGRMVRSRGNKENSAPFQLQVFDIVCSTSWASRDKCCELPGLRKEADCPAMPKACTCTQDSKGPAGPAGPPGGPGIRGARGDRGEPGPVGPTGPVGDTGVAGPQGPQGPQGPSGRSIIGPPGSPGERGQKGEAGQQGTQGIAGRAGAPGRDGPAGPRGLTGKDGPPGRPGPSGTMGTPGAPGAPGHTGPSGKQGELGPPGPHGGGAQKMLKSCGSEGGGGGGTPGTPGTP